MSTVPQNHTPVNGADNACDTLRKVLAYRQAGLSVIPIRRDGSKAPTCAWKDFQSRLPTEAELREWFDFPRPPGVATVAGKVSGNLEIIDFDWRAETIFPAWIGLVELEAPGLFDRLNVVKTPGSGYHARYRCRGSAIPGNTKLATDPAAPPNEQTLIETRGEGGYALAPGSPPECHEDKLPYVHHSGPALENIQDITAEERDVLIRAARSLDRSVVPEAEPSTPLADDEVSPGDDFSSNGPDWAELLEPAGWALARQDGCVRYWRRPGKGKGWSATTGVCKSSRGWELFAVFSSNAAPFEGPANGKPCSCYSKFAVFALLNHRADFSAAARELARQGYGRGKGRASTATSASANKAGAEAPASATAKAAAINHKTGRPKDSAKPRLPTPFQTFPIAALPALCRRLVVEGAAAIGCDPAFVALPFLSAVAAAVGNARRLELKRGWTEPAVIWTAIVGDSGTLKSPALDLAVRPVQVRQSVAIHKWKLALADYQAKQKDYEDSLADWRRDRKKTPRPVKPEGEEPVCERVLVSDATVESLALVLQNASRGLLLNRDELAGWIGSFDLYKAKGKGADVAHWLEMHRAGKLIVDRKSGPEKLIHVPRAAVCVTGGIQPETLRRALGREHFEDGLAARLLLAMPPPRDRRWNEEEVDPDLETEIVHLFDRLYSLEMVAGDDGLPCPVTLRLTAAGKDAWVLFFDAHSRERDELSGDLAATWSKLEGYAARLALVVQCMRWAETGQPGGGPSAVDEQSVNAGAALSRWFGYEAQRVYAVLGESDKGREHRRLAEWVERKGGTVTARDLQMGKRCYRESSEAAEKALDELVKAGIGEWVNVGPTGRGGRPTDEFRLVNSVNVNKTHLNYEESEGFVDVDTVDEAESEGAEEIFEGEL